MHASKVVNQFEAHPLLQQPELMKYCQEHNIHITAYSPLGNNSNSMPYFIFSQSHPNFLVEGRAKLTENPVVVDIAKRIGADVAQVLIAWATRRGVSVIPKSVHENRIVSNFKEVEITDDDFARISKIGEGDARYRYIVPIFFKPSWSVNVFGEEREKHGRLTVKVK